MTITTSLSHQKNGFSFDFTGFGKNGASWRVSYNGAFFANVSTAAVIRAMTA